MLSPSTIVLENRIWQMKEIDQNDLISSVISITHALRFNFFGRFIPSKNTKTRKTRSNLKRLIDRLLISRQATAVGHKTKKNTMWHKKLNNIIIIKSDMNEEIFFNKLSHMFPANATNK